jgi:hypothetical protein
VLKVACDDVATIYVDGTNVEVQTKSGRDYYIDSITIPQKTYVVALACENILLGAYLCAETEDGIWLNSSNTKCSNLEQPNWTDTNFDDSNWRHAYSFGYVKLFILFNLLYVLLF